MDHRTIWDWIGFFFESTIFAYGLVLLLVYALLAILSFYAIRAYLLSEESANPQHDLITSPLAPGISVLAPAYNEGLTIIQNVRSLLTLNYPDFEIIIINDGSTDSTLEQLVAEFDLQLVDFAYHTQISTRPIRGVYKSTNAAYSRLMIIDKVNGKSKADAVNAGINIAANDLFVCTDVDCILHVDTLLELVKPVLKEPKKRVIAVGATLRLANSCEFDEGVMVRMRPPKQWLARFQEVEYIRSFVLGKMGWSKINCVPNVSGGLGLFDKEIAIKAGGYDSKSFGEDMELMFRMCRFASDNGIPYAIRYLPKTLCWTEGPAMIKVFKRQRTRWAKGLAQLMYAHFKMFMRPRYGRMGMVVMPYNFFFELLAPIIEALGVLFYIAMIVFGVINWPWAMILLLFVYTYAIMITTLSIVWDQLAFRYYRSWKEVAQLCIVPFFEFIFYHPLIVVFSLMGYWDFLTGKKGSWGNMQRQGFGGAKSK